MALFKFGDMQVITQTKVRGDVKPEATVKNGYVGKLNATSGKFEQFDSDAEAQADVWMVGNVIDTPELDNSADFEILTSQYVRIWNLNDVVGKQIEVSSNIADDDFADVAVGDYLIPQGSAYTFVERTTETGTYAVALLVKEKTTMGTFTIDGGGNGGYLCEVVSVTFA